MNELELRLKRLAPPPAPAELRERIVRGLARAAPSFPRESWLDLLWGERRWRLGSLVAGLALLAGHLALLPMPAPGGSASVLAAAPHRGAPTLPWHDQRRATGPTWADVTLGGRPGWRP